MNIAGTCSSASESEAPQTLAIVLSVLFSLYVGSAILLSSLQIYAITSEATTASKKGGPSTTGIGVDAIPFVEMSSPNIL